MDLLEQHGLQDSVAIDYEGKWSKNLFAGTITSRKKFRTPIEFRHAFYNFLREINYGYAIAGVMEYHEQKGRQDKVHAHVMLYSGGHPKNNKTNLFSFHIQKISNEKWWKYYCSKNIMHTLEQARAVYSGHYDFIQSKSRNGYYLFGDESILHT